MHTALIPVIILLTSLIGPGPESVAHMCYESGTKRLLLVQVDSAQETLWTLADSGWTRLNHAGPTAREISGAACDSQRNRFVLYGGIGRNSGGARSGETWEWDGMRWRNVGGAEPGPRSHHVMAFDEARGVTVMYGGGGSDRELSDDTWEWDGRNWQRVATQGPGRRAHFAMAYDPVRKLTILFGGFDDKFRYNNETWGWDGRTWTRLAEGIPAPPIRSHHDMAFDRRNGQLVLVGGLRNGNFRTPLGDTWTFDGRQWREVTSAGGLPALSGHVMAYDPVRERVVMYGGHGWNAAAASSIHYRDTWLWDGTRWLKRD